MSVRFLSVLSCQTISVKLLVAFCEDEDGDVKVKLEIKDEHKVKPEIKDEVKDEIKVHE